MVTQNSEVQLGPSTSRWCSTRACSFTTPLETEEIQYDGRPGVLAAQNAVIRGRKHAWERFLSYFGHIPDQVGNTAYGVVHNVDDDGMVFKHRRHISTISGTYLRGHLGSAVPESGHEVVDAPVLEVYGPEFDSRSGHGGPEVWVPIKS